MIKALFTKCIFHEFTGLYCPGCGGTRAFFALLHGHPVLSFRYNPVVEYFLFFFIFYVVWFLLYFLKKKVILREEKNNTISSSRKIGLAGKLKKIQRPRFLTVFVWIFLVLVLTNMLVKDFALLFFQIDLMP